MDNAKRNRCAVSPATAVVRARRVAAIPAVAVASGNRIAPPRGSLWEGAFRDVDCGNGFVTTTCKRTKPPTKQMGWLQQTRQHSLAYSDTRAPSLSLERAGAGLLPHLLTQDGAPVHLYQRCLSTAPGSRVLLRRKTQMLYRPSRYRIVVLPPTKLRTLSLKQSSSMGVPAGQTE